MFNKEVKEAKQANFKVTDKDGKFMIVSAVTLDAKDKTKAVLTFAEKFKDKMEYTVESVGVIGADDKAMAKDSDKFTFMNAEVTAIEFTETTVPFNADLRDYLKVTDALGRDVTKEVDIKFDVDSSGLVSAAGIAAALPGQAIVTAKVKVGKNWVKTAETTITISDAVATEYVGFDLYTGAPQAADTEAFMKLPEDKKVDYLNMNGGRKKIALYYKDQYGKPMNAVTAGITITDVVKTVSVSDSMTQELIPVSEGEAYFRVKKDKAEATIKVTVRAEQKLAKIVPEETSIKIVEDPALGTRVIKLKYEDQFGAAFALGASPAVESDDTAVATVSILGNDVTIVPVKKGTAVVTLTSGTVKAEIEVEVAEAGDLAGYMMEATPKEIDLETGDETMIKVFSRDANGNKLKDVTTSINGGTRKLIAVDKDGNPDPNSILVVDSIIHNKVKATDIGVGYLKVQVEGYTEKQLLEIKVVHTGRKITTIEFKDTKIDFGTDDVDIDKTNGIELKGYLQKGLKLKDQYGALMSSPIDYDAAQLAFEYEIFDVDGTDWDQLTQDAKLMKLTKPNAKAKLALNKVTYSGGPNLLKTPIFTELEAIDTTAPVLQIKVGAAAAANLENDNLRTKEDVKIVWSAKDVKEVKLQKNTDPEAPYTADTNITASGLYTITATDEAGNTVTRKFLIDKDAPEAAASNPIVGTSVDGDKDSYLAGDTITIRFSEPVKVSEITLVNLTLNNGHVWGAASIAPKTSGEYATEFVITTASDTTAAKDDTITILAAKVIDSVGNVAAGNVVFTIPQAQ